MYQKKSFSNQPLSGLSLDYKLAFASLSNLSSELRRMIHSYKAFSIKSVRHRKIKNYTEYFSDLGFDDFLTDANERQLNIIKENVDLLNELRTMEKIDVKQLQKIHSLLLSTLKGV